MEQEQKIPRPNMFRITYLADRGMSPYENVYPDLHFMSGRDHWTARDMALNLKEAGGFELNSQNRRNYTQEPKFVPYHNILSVQKVSRP